MAGRESDGIVALSSGAEVLIRPVRPEDGPLLRDAFSRLSPESRYRRFLSPHPELSAGEVRYLTDVDHHGHEALAALDPGSGAGIGIGRYVRLADAPQDAEIAVTVVDDWHGRGVGTALLERLAARARAEGITTFCATMLSTNHPVLDLLRKLGDVQLGPVEAGTVVARVDLEELAASRTTLPSLVRAAASGAMRLVPEHNPLRAPGARGRSR